MTIAGALSLSLGVRSARAEDAVAEKVEQAHREIWRRFIDTHDVLIDYADAEGKFPCPTPEECREGKPNALGWWSPIENGSMFNGMYMDGICARWRATKSPEAREKARRLAKGLLLLSSLGPAGFLARGLATDGRTPYPMGSDDQSGPWLVGVWRYLQEDIATPEERTALVKKFAEVARVLESSQWRMPCNEGAPSAFRGTFAGHTWQHAPRLLFLLKAAHQLTGDEKWNGLYLKMAHETGGIPERTRVQICADGMVYHHPNRRESWTGASSVIALRALWEMEKAETLREAYARGLAASAKVAAGGVPLSDKFSNESKSAFLSDWRVFNEWWQPQRSEAEAVAVAQRQSKEFNRLSPRRYEEFTFVREPAFAAWIVTMCPDRSVVLAEKDAILKTLGHYDYARLNYSQFFPVEAAWYRLAEATRESR
jgi:hypothetical protein